MSAKLKQGFMRNVKLGAGTLRLLMNLWPPFIGAGAGYQSLFDSLDAGTLSVAFNPGDWKRALESVEQESRRLAEYGVSDAELQREIVNTRTALQNAVASAATRST